MEIAVEAPDALRAGRRALDDVEGCEIHEDLRWVASENLWCLHLSLTPSGLLATEYVPCRTHWYLTVGDEYPGGRIGLYPAKEGGITHTFWHQIPNGPGSEENPWRSGNICTDTVLRTLGRYGYDQEPREPRDRIRWHVRRAMAWLRAAAREELVCPGDDYELPAFSQDTRGIPVIGFNETPETFRTWADLSVSVGEVDLVRHPGNQELIVPRRFKTCDGKTLVDVAWGHQLSSRSEVEVGLWIRLGEVPVLPPWKAPASWKELWQAIRRSGEDPGVFLKRLPPRFRDGLSRHLLIGFPVPRRFNEPPERLHWLATRLPVFSRGRQTVDGFRGCQGGWAIRDWRRLLSRAPLELIATENWAEDQVSTRGHFGAELRSKSVLLIGAGALGSAVAELLVRGGVHKITVVDGDTLHAGNLVRHSLSMADVARPDKGKALAEWLNQLSPHARVSHLEGNFPPADLDAVGSIDLVLDCTGEDDLLRHLAKFPWPGERTFVSLSLGLYARRLFFFQASGRQFPARVMTEQLHSWLKEEQENLREEDLPWESIGCWHPVFPARVEDIRLFAALAVKRLDLGVKMPERGGLSVFVRDEDGTSVREETGV